MVKQYRLVVLEKWVNKNSITGNDQYNITIGLPDGDSRHLNDISKTLRLLTQILDKLTLKEGNGGLRLKTSIVTYED